MLPHIAREAARRFGETPAFSRPDGTSLTYRELDERSDAVAAALRSQSVAEGDVVALVLPSTTDYVVTYVALAKLGAITAGVNPRLTSTEREAILQVAQPNLVIDEPDVTRLADAGRELAPPAPLADDPERVVAVAFTSGTTGNPKGAIFCNRQIDAIGRSDMPGWDDDAWGGGGHMLAATQFAHIGFMTKLAWYLRLGTTTHLLDRWRSSDVLRLVSEHHMTSLGGVAPQLALLLRDPDFDSYDLSCVRTIVMGGALSPPALVAEARRRIGAEYSIRYSSTESGGVGTGTAFDADDEESLFTVGRPRAGVEVAIRDDEDAPVAAGQVGELCLRSPCMMSGYWRDPVATAEAIRDGWLYTGDLAMIDDAGRVRLAGRKKEMFVRGGYNVYPLEVEAVLASHPAVTDVAVVPRSDEVMGETGVAVVVAADPDRPPTLDDLRSFAGEHLAAYKLPEALRVVAELPLTAMQKVDRRALARHEGRRLS